jgi:hypothetical protein
MSQSHLHTIIRKLKAYPRTNRLTEDGKLPCACGRCNKTIKAYSAVIAKRTNSIAKVYLIGCAARLGVIDISDSDLAEIYKQEAMLRGALNV